MEGQTPRRAQRALTPKQKAVRRRKAILGWLSMLFILVILGVVIFAIASIVSQMNKVTELQKDFGEYTQLSQLPTKAEEDEQKRLEELEKIDLAFRERDSYPIEMEIRSPICVMYDVQAKELLYVKNGNDKAFPASTTKVLTSAVMLEYCPEGTLFEAGSEQSMVQDGSSLANIEGMTLDRDNMLDAIMVCSGNDASYCAAAVTGRLIAQNESLSAKEAVTVFVDKMNETAKLIGCKGTHFTCPDGFHDDEHYTTAMDLLKIAVYSQRFPQIAASGAKASAHEVFPSGEETDWENSNRLLDEYSDRFYTYATGLKTGMTDVSGYCIIATARRFEHDVVMVILGSEDSDLRYSEAIALFDQGFQYIRNRPDKTEEDTASEEEGSSGESAEESSADSE